jgi:hypothetical protein
MTAQEIVQELIGLGLSFAEIAEKTDKRVSERTIRRYYNGEAEPRQPHNLVVLEQLLTKTKQESKNG